MKRKLCDACKELGKYNSGDYVDVIYHTHGSPSYLRLCYGHSVELFKFGQKSFISKYEIDIPDKFHPGTSSSVLNNYFVFNSFK